MSAGTGDAAPARLLLVTPNFENNSTGRTFCLWALARHLGLRTRVIGVNGRQVWSPVADGDFAAACEVLTPMADDERTRRLTAAVRWADVVVAVKPLPTSFGLVAPIAGVNRRPLVVDVDDPDIEYRLRWQPLRRRVKARLTGRRALLLRLRDALPAYPLMVSNPVLQQRYGGVVIPHARPSRPAPSHRDRPQLTIRFVGSVQEHMGVDVLRRAVAKVQSAGFRLEVTDRSPRDSRSWESWLGRTTFADGQSLVEGADLVVLPSLPRSWSLAQLPAKLVDAMMFGRPVIASDLPPIRWALGGTGKLVPPADEAALAAALMRLRDADLRHHLGSRAHARAVELFSCDAVAPEFLRVLEQAVADGSPG